MSPVDSLLTQDVIWMLIQRFLNVMNVRRTLKQRFLVTGLINQLINGVYFI